MRQNIQNQPTQKQLELKAELARLLNRSRLGFQKGERLPFALEWIQQNHTTEDVIFAIQQFKTPTNKLELAKAGVSYLDGVGATEVINQFDDPENKSEVALLYLASEGFEYKVKDGIDVDQLTRLLPFVISSYTKSSIAMSYLTTNNGFFRVIKEGVTTDQLIELLPFVNKESDKSSIASSWAEKLQTVEDVKKVIDQFDDPKCKSRVAISYLEKYLLNLATHHLNLPEDPGYLLEIMPFVDSNYSKLKAAKSYVISTQNLEGVRKVIDQFDDPEDKSEIAISYLTTREQYRYKIKNQITADQLIELLPFVNQKSIKLRIASSWAEATEKSFEDVKKVIDQFDDPEDKSEVALSYLTTYERYQKSLKNEITADQLIELLPFFKKNWKSLLLNAWFSEQARSTEEIIKFNNAGVVGRNGNKYDIEELTHLYSILEARNFGSTAFSFPQFCKDLYPGLPELQIDTFITGAAGIFDDQSRTLLKKENLDQFLSFVQEIEDDDRAYEAFKAVKIGINKAQNLGQNFLDQPEYQEEVLKCAQGRLQKHYSSVLEILEKPKVSESFTEEALQNLEPSFLKNKKDELSIADVFSYWIMTEGNDTVATKFISCLKPEISQQIKENFVPSDQVVLIKNRNYQVIRALIGNSALSSSSANASDQEENSDPEIPSVKTVSDVLKAKVSLPSLTEEQIENFHFGENECLDNFPKKTEEKNTAFRDLLNKKNLATQKEVIDTFELILGAKDENPENSIINASSQGSSLEDFFHTNHLLLAALLKEDGGLDNFSRFINTASDGCWANISTHASIAMIGLLIKENEALQVIFSVYNDHLSHPILSSSTGVDHVTNADASAIFGNRTVNENYISPPGFLKKIEEEFYKEVKDNKFKKGRDSTNFIRKYYTKQENADFADDFALSLVDKYPNKYEHAAAKLASFLVLKEIMPELLNNKHLKNFAEEMKKLEAEIKGGILEPSSSPTSDHNVTPLNQQLNSKIR